MGVVTVNGVQIVVPDGGSVSIINGVVHVNGQRHDEAGQLSGVIELRIEGDVGSVRADHGSITCLGSVKGDVNAGGAANISGNVGGKVNAGGSVTCMDVGGSINAGGSVRCASSQRGSNVGGHQAGRDINIG